MKIKFSIFHLNVTIFIEIYILSKTVNIIFIIVIVIANLSPKPHKD